MKISVKLKPGHPTGTYRRTGRVFSASAPTIVEASELTREEAKALKNDPWLSIETAAEPKDPKDPK